MHKKGRYKNLKIHLKKKPKCQRSNDKRDKQKVMCTIMSLDFCIFVNISIQIPPRNEYLYTEMDLSLYKMQYYLCEEYLLH